MLLSCEEEAGRVAGKAATFAAGNRITDYIGLGVVAKTPPQA
jgi:hypothetical protein